MAVSGCGVAPCRYGILHDARVGSLGSTPDLCMITKVGERLGVRSPSVLDFDDVERYQALMGMPRPFNGGNSSPILPCPDNRQSLIYRSNFQVMLQSCR